MQYYFSHVRLLASPRQNEWLRGLARHGEPYRDHALIWKLFPGDGAARDFVFRRLNDECTYYVVSARPPQPESGLFQIQSKPYAPRLEKGEWLRFELRANPTVSVRREQGRSQRHDVLMNAKRSINPEQRNEMASVLASAGKDWLLNRAEQLGLAIREETLLQDGYRQHQLMRKGSNIRYSTLDYQGIAQVTDPDCASKALLEGVGHSKGFGCGLLLVKRIR